MPDILTYFDNYTPSVDILTLSICVLFIILIRASYINKTKSFIYLKHMIYLLILGGFSNIIFHILLDRVASVPHFWIYLTRGLYHFSLYGILFMYVLYVKENLQMNYHVYRVYFSLAAIGFIFLMGYEVLSMEYGFGFVIEEDNSIHTGFTIFPFAYLYYIGIVIFMLINHGQKIYRRVYFGILSSIGISMMVMIIQQIYQQSSFTASSFLFPIFSRLYLVHASPYDIEMGAVSESAFEDIINYKTDKKIEMYIMSIYMHDFDGKGRKYPGRLMRVIRQFMTAFFKDATLFHISGGHLILTVDKKKNPDYLANADKMLDEFYNVYERLRIDYKIVFTDTFEEITKANDYLGLIKYIQDNISQNSVLKVNPKEKDDYLKFKYIVAELADINKANDLQDERVLVYCQPVYNIRKHCYDTAEALMRLKLPDIGMVFPDIFIPIAEQHQYISSLTRIILFKTCQQIKALNDAGYYVRRISVNFSVYDFQSDELCNSIESMIKENGIDPRQIAIEITESQNESDFNMIKNRIDELKGTGMKFYLDDFGTGYSNFERIMEIPFDIVKFDRSLVIASGNDSKYKTMVSHLAEMFSSMEYGVLYEGVENNDDENRCINMNANYLQGYKYSKPIPIENLTEYFSKLKETKEIKETKEKK